MKQEQTSCGGMTNPTFSIRGCFYKGHCFPGLNDYISELGTSWRLGGKMKKDYQMIACNAIRRSLKRYKATKPVILHYHFAEPKKGNKRDRMNVFSFADKVIEDALQVCKVIVNDDPKHVLNTTHTFEDTNGEPSITVQIEEIGT